MKEITRQCKPLVRCAGLQRGLGLLEVTLWLVAIAGVGLATFAGWQVWQAQRLQRDQVQAEEIIDRKMQAYAVLHDRLPCPDIDRDGWEDRTGSSCTTTAQKGWLPWRTLGLEGVARDVAARGLVYLVQRRGDDLTEPSNRFEPPRFEQGHGYAAARDFNVLSSHDWCVGLKTAAQRPYTAGDAAVDPDQPQRVAYAIAWPGSTASAAGAFGGVNADMAVPQLESPRRIRWAAGYGDRVVARTPADLWARFSCAEQLQAIASAAMATDVNEEVQGQKTANFMSATLSSGISTVKMGVGAIKVGLAIAGAVTAGSHLVAATTELASAIAGCAVLVGCALIPKAAAAVAAAAASVAAYVGAAALSATAAAVNLAAAIQAAIPAAQAGVAMTATFNVDAAKAQAASNLSTSQSRRDAAYDDWQSAQTAMTAVTANLDDARSRLVDTVQSRVYAANGAGNCNPSNPNHYGCFTLSTATYTAYVNDFELKAQRWIDADAAYQSAQKSLEKAENANSDAPQTPTAFSSDYSPVNVVDLLRARLASETDPQKRVEIQTAIDWLSNPANSAATTYTYQTSNADNRSQIQQSIAGIEARRSQLNAQIATLDSQIGGASCSPEPSVDPLRTQCRERRQAIDERDALLQQRLSLQQALDHMTLSVDDARSKRDLALAARDSRAAEMNAAKTQLINAMAALPYRYCSSTTTGTGAGAVTTWTCETRTYNGSGAPLAAQIDDLRDKRNAYALKQREVSEKQLAYFAAERAYNAALSMKASLDALGSGSNPTALEIMVWQGAADILRTVDGRGGIR